MQDPVIGIDLGTTNSLIAAVERGRAEVIRGRSGSRLMPSMVGFLPTGERVVGERAKRLLEEQPEQVAYAVKRFLGRRWTPSLAAMARSVVPYPLVSGPREEVRVKIAGRTVPATQLSAMVLMELRLDAAAHFGQPVDRAVITVPANFDDGQRNATKEAARIAGLEILRLVNEPTAAAVAYGLSRGFEGSCLVFDLGGGTFDVSVLEVRDGVFEVRATGGDPMLGGFDFDQAVVQWLCEQLSQPQLAAVQRDKLSMQRLLVAAEHARRTLSTSTQTLIAIEGLGDRSRTRGADISFGASLSREKLEGLCAPLLQRCTSVCAEVLGEARMRPQDLKAVLLVGGMTRMPLVQRAIADFFGRLPETGINPDEAVALGAAQHAAELSHARKAALLIDVAAHSVGVGMAGGSVRRLIGRNTPIPVTASEIFLPARTDQQEARLPIYQGESARAAENVKLGEIVLKDLRTGDRLERGIEVRFELAQDGTLSVRAMDTTSGIAEALKIEARAVLSEAEEASLRKDQEAYSRAALTRDATTTREELVTLLGEATQLARKVEDAIRQGTRADLVAQLGAIKALVNLGQAALEGGAPEELAAIRRRLLKVVRVDAPPASPAAPASSASPVATDGATLRAPQMTRPHEPLGSDAAEAATARHDTVTQEHAVDEAGEDKTQQVDVTSLQERHPVALADTGAEITHPGIPQAGANLHTES